MQSTDNTAWTSVSGRHDVVSIAFLNAEIDGLLVGESFRIKIIRDAVSDTMTEDAQLLRIEIKET